MVDVAQLVRVSDCGSEGRGFEPRLPPYFTEREVSYRSLFLFLHTSQRHSSDALSLLPVHKMRHREKSVKRVFSLLTPEPINFIRHILAQIIKTSTFIPHIPRHKII